ncbi:MAG: hypothetical protein Q8916_01655 [Bacteroidota bacterium]|nr:hypothetical protein [Bacteroidota bacterium]
MKLASRGFLAALVLLIVCGHLVAQTPNERTVDQSEGNPETWKTASLALPYGFVFSAGFPIIGGANAHDGFIDKANAGFDFYYDAWALGIHQTQHGDVFRFGPRSLSRELYGGWYFEVGTRGFNYYKNYNDSVSRSGSLVILALGFGNKTNYTSLSKVALIGAYRVTLGDAEGIGSHNSYGIIEFEYDIGLRIPLEKNSLSFMLGFNGGLGLPDVSRIPNYYNDGTFGHAGLILTAQYAINLDKY